MITKGIKSFVGSKCCSLNSFVKNLILTPSEPPVLQPLRLTWDNISNVPVADANSVSDWNSFFVLPTNGTPFSSVIVVGNEVQLYGGAGITLTFFSLSANANLVSIIDDALCIVLVKSTALDQCAALTTIVLNGCLTFEDVACYYNPQLQYVTANAATSIGVSCFEGNNSLVVCSFPEVLTIGAGCFSGSPQVALNGIYLPKCIDLGGTTGYDNVFSPVGVTFTLTVPAALMTCNGGNPDGDIAYLQANNTVTIVTTNNSFLLLESGGNILLESGFKIILQSS